jgi:hypothetical protein
MHNNVGGLRHICTGPDLQFTKSGQDLIETMPSISTEICIGSEPMPTAERACLPLSPNTSTNRSDKPLATLGWS